MLERLSQQLQQDQRENAGAVEADEADHSSRAAETAGEIKRQQTVADDRLECPSDQQALDNENTSVAGGSARVVAALRALQEDYRHGQGG